MHLLLYTCSNTYVGQRNLIACQYVSEDVAGHNISNSISACALLMKLCYEGMHNEMLVLTMPREKILLTRLCFMHSLLS